MGHGGGAAGRHFGVALNIERPAFNCPKSANPAAPIAAQTPRRDAAKGTADIVTLCSFPMQGNKPACTGETLLGGGAADGGDTRAGGKHYDKKRGR